MTSFSQVLLDWFDQYGRTELPWQRERSPYRVWVSEIMLQQTQVTTVIPYFERFIKNFASVQALAEADEDLVLHHWSGLGYYARGRNLHKTARLITEKYHGIFPNDIKTLMALPGIGRSTAGAILSIAYGIRAPILDGNVKRTLSRLYGIEGWPGQASIGKRLWELADDLTPTDRIADYTQAMMDFGATICTRSTPRCAACPFQRTCVAYAENKVLELPTRKPKKALPARQTFMLVLKNDRGEVLLEKRPPTGVWGSLWCFPESVTNDRASILDRWHLRPSSINALQTDCPFRHTFTHFHLDITPVHVELTGQPLLTAEREQRWVSPGELVQVGIPTPVMRLLDTL